MQHIATHYATHCNMFSSNRCAMPVWSQPWIRLSKTKNRLATANSMSCTQTKTRGCWFKAVSIDINWLDVSTVVIVWSITRFSIWDVSYSGTSVYVLFSVRWSPCYCTQQQCSFLTSTSLTIRTKRFRAMNAEKSVALCGTQFRLQLLMLAIPAWACEDTETNG